MKVAIQNILNTDHNFDIFGDKDHVLYYSVVVSSTPQLAYHDGEVAVLIMVVIVVIVVMLVDYVQRPPRYSFLLMN